MNNYHLILLEDYSYKRLDAQIMIGYFFIIIYFVIKFNE